MTTGLRRPFRLFLFVAIILLSRIPADADGEVRTWTNSTGLFRVEATLERIEGEKIVLRTTDGKLQKISLAKLSHEDRAYIAELASKSPFEAEDDDTPPTAPLDPSAKVGVSNLPVFDFPVRQVDLRDGDEGGGSDGTSWSCPADPSTVPAIKEKPRNIHFPLEPLPSSVFPKETGFFFYSVDATLHVLTALNIDRERDDKQKSRSFVYLADVQAGQCECLEFDRKLTPFGVSPNGKKALFRVDEWGSGMDWGKRRYVHIVQIDGKKLFPFAAYEPFAQDRKPNKHDDKNGDVEWGTWVDDEHVMLCSPSNRLIVLNVETGKIAWKMSNALAGSSVAFSPGLKYCLIPNSSGVLLLESRNGKAIGRLDGDQDQLFVQDFAFSPDGGTIATYGNDGIQLWDATTGKTEEPFYIGSFKFPSIQWIDNRFLMADDYLIDIETRSPLWSYRSFARSGRFHGGFCWYLNGYAGKGKYLVSATIPHSKALLASQDPESKRFAVGPGMEVSLQIDDSVREGRDEIQRKMDEFLKDNRIVCKPAAPVALRLKVVPEREETVIYGVGHRFLPPSPFFRGGGTEIKYHSVRFSIEFKKGDKTLWALAKTTCPPNNIALDKVQQESLQAVVDQAMGKENAAYKQWFLNAKIPKSIPDFDRIGKSILLDSGIRDE